MSESVGRCSTWNL